MSEAGSPWESVPPIVPRWRTCGSPIWAAANDTIGQCSASSASDATDRMARHRADGDVGAAVLDVRELGEPAEVGELRRTRDAQLQRRDQRLTARKQLRVASARGEQLDRVLDALRDVVVEPGRNHDFASWIARQTRSGVAGIWMSFTPR